MIQHAQFYINFSNYTQYILMSLQMYNRLLNIRLFLLIFNYYPFFNTIYLCSLFKPVLISGPFVSNAIATGFSFLYLKASFNLATVSPWTLWSPWEKLSLATLIPASINYTNVGTSQQAGLIIIIIINTQLYKWSLLLSLYNLFLIGLFIIHNVQKNHIAFFL